MTNAERKSLNKLFSKLEEFAKEACRLKLIELFPDVVELQIQMMIRRLLPACICIKSSVTPIARLDPVIFEIISVWVDPNLVVKKFTEVEYFCYRLSQVIDSLYLEIEEGNIKPQDFVNNLNHY